MILLTPGPTPVPQTVLRAIARPIIPHRSEAFEQLYAQCQAGLQLLFRTRGPVLTLASSGTGAMEAAIWSLVRPGSTIVTCANGKFGQRWLESADRAAHAIGARAQGISAPWGEPLSPDALEKTLRSADNVAAVVFVHCETSAATLNDARALAAIARQHAPEALVIVDGITSVGALPVEPGLWGLDAVACAPHKALGLPPGLGFVSLGERAVDALHARAGAAMPFYLDLSEALRAHDKGSTPFTPAVNLFFGLAESLRLIDMEGVESRWRRAARLAEATRRALGAMGLKLASKSPSDSVTAVWTPERVGDTLRSWCMAERGVALAGGQGDWKGRVLRMSHMGFIAEDETIAGVEAVAAGLDALAPDAFDTRAGVVAIHQALARPEPAA